MFFGKFFLKLNKAIFWIEMPGQHKVDALDSSWCIEPFYFLIAYFSKVPFFIPVPITRVINSAFVLPVGKSST